MTSKDTQEKIDRRERSRTNLEFKLYQNIAGSNQVKSDPFLYGQLGLQGGEETYISSMDSEEIRKRKDQDYKQRRKEGERLGIAGEPAYPTDYSVSLRIVKQLEESKALLSLGELEEVIKNVASGLELSVPEEISVPEELRDMFSYELMEKVAEGQTLTKKEEEALVRYELLSKVYNRCAAIRASRSGSFTDLKQMGEQISEKYRPKDSQQSETA